MKRIPHGDVDAQLATITEHMYLVLKTVYEGKHIYGRSIALSVGAPYPQTYGTLHTLFARGFLICHEVENDRGGEFRKVYQITERGQELLKRVTENGVSTRKYRRRDIPRVDPNEYVERMRLNPVFRWLRDHGVVDSYAELAHVMKCDTCNALIREHGFTGDVRCEEAADKVNDKEWT